MPSNHSRRWRWPGTNRCRSEDASLLRAHTPEHLQRLDLPFDIDADTPAYPQIAAHARRAAGGALQALQSARAGEMSFSLMRPPGHHATRDRAMGFCYLNSIAIAVLGGARRRFPARGRL